MVARIGNDLIADLGVADSFGLTKREHEIIRLICDGLSNKEIARKLACSEGTVKVHLHNIYGKLVIRNRTQLAVWGNRDA